MAIRIITGHTGTSHITSLDARAMNRSIVGNGKYILADENKVGIKSISDAQAKIKFKAGSLLWNGVHIRIEEDTEVYFTLPSSETTVAVYIHYAKAEGVESVSLSETGMESELTDESTSACAKLFSFVWAGTGEHNNKRFHFTEMSSLGMTITEMGQWIDSAISNLRNDVEQSITELETSVNQSISALITSVNGQFTTLKSNIKSHSKLGQTASLSSGSETVSLSESANHFQYLCFVFAFGANHECSATIPVSFISDSSATKDISASVPMSETKAIFARATISAMTANSITFNRQAYSLEKSGLSWGMSESNCRVSIYGIGKVV